MPVRLAGHRGALVRAAAARDRLRWGAVHPCLFSWDAWGDAHRVAVEGEVLRDLPPDGAAEKLVDLELDALAQDGSQSAAPA